VSYFNSVGEGNRKIVGDYVLSRCSLTFMTSISGTNQPPKANGAFLPSGVGKWRPASAGKAKACMVHCKGMYGSFR